MPAPGKGNTEMKFKPPPRLADESQDGADVFYRRAKMLY